MEIVLDARRFKGRTRAHAYLKEALRLPDYYGKNLDALYDCLGDIGEETVIVVPEVIQKRNTWVITAKQCCGFLKTRRRKMKR